MNDKQCNFLTLNFGEIYARITDGIIKKVDTGEVIPTELTIYQKAWPDGLYRLGEMTCGGGGIPKNLNKNDQNVKNKYECRVGRKAPLCEMYSPKECAVYSFDDVDRLDLHIKPTDLIKMFDI